jgi:hypothetical protein
MEAYIEKGLVYFDAEQYQRALDVFKFASTVNNLYADRLLLPGALLRNAE